MVHIVLRYGWTSSTKKSWHDLGFGATAFALRFRGDKALELLSKMRQAGSWKRWEDLQDGAPKIAKLLYKWLNSMVYGRYNHS